MCAHTRAVYAQHTRARSALQQCTHGNGVPAPILQHVCSALAAQPAACTRSQHSAHRSACSKLHTNKKSIISLLKASCSVRTAITLKHAVRSSVEKWLFKMNPDASKNRCYIGGAASWKGKNKRTKPLFCYKIPCYFIRRSPRGQGFCLAAGSSRQQQLQHQAQSPKTAGGGHRFIRGQVPFVGYGLAAAPVTVTNWRGVGVGTRQFDAPVADASSKSMPPISLQRVADCAPVAACKSRIALGSVASRNAALAPVGSKRAAGGGAAGGAED